jgi:predicted HTH domain antitoxin
MGFTVSDELLQTVHLSAEEFRREIAVMLFQQERFTLAQAARFCGMSRIEFQRLLASRKIPVHYDVEEYERDIRMMKEAGLL